MSKFRTLRIFVNQRLSLAAAEIFELFERTIGEYEEELCRQHKLLDAVFKPDVRLHRADIQQRSMRKEEVPLEQQEWSLLLDQEEQPELPLIKEEQEEVWSSEEGEPLQGLEEADISDITFSPVSLKSEEDEEKLQSSRLHQRQTQQIKTEADEEDCGGPGPAKNLNLDSHLQPATHEQTSHPSEPETDGSCDWEETREPQTGFSTLQDNEEPVSDLKCNAGTNKRWKHSGKKEREPFGCSVCEKKFKGRGDLVRHIRVHTGEKPFSCALCEKRFTQNSSLKTHLRIHASEKMRDLTGEKPFSCSVCGKRFTQKNYLKNHSRIHTREKMRDHTGEKPFSCSVCGKRFTQKNYLKNHLRIHTREKMRDHTGEKPFSCSVCGKRFTRKDSVKRHSRFHTGEKPFSRSVRGKRFSCGSGLTNH